MSTVIIDQDTRTRLGNLEDRLELRDETGRVLGYFTPAPDRSLYDNVDSPVSVQELRRRERAGGGRTRRTLSEILADLEKWLSQRLRSARVSDPAETRDRRSEMSQAN
jgi:hypothetical protein